ncbi:T9SS type A sorting domain-containing protein [Hymenobacter koreensis]
MKKLLLSLLTFSLSFAGFAQQIPNGNFETWEMRNGLEAPRNWINTDEFLRAFAPIPIPVAINTVTKSTDARSGSFAARLENKNISFGGLPIGVAPGIMILGTRVNSNSLGGLPFTGRPAALQFSHKLTGPNAVNDSASVQVILTRTQNGQVIPIAGADYLFTQTAANFTQLTIPLDYDSNLAPDSIQIFITSGDAEDITAGTTLIIDDITMVGTALSSRDKVAGASALTVYPNPSTDGLFTLGAAQEPALLKSALTVTDATGRKVLTQPAASTVANGVRTLDLRGRPAGVYTLQLTTPEGPVTRRLVVR